MGKTEEGDALIPHFRHQERSSLQHHADLTLELHADVADWNPNTGFQRLLAVGTYELDEATRLRHGRLYTYEVVLGRRDHPGVDDDDDDDDDDDGVGDDRDSPLSKQSATLRLAHTVGDLPGIFDLQFIQAGASSPSPLPSPSPSPSPSSSPSSPSSPSFIGSRGTMVALALADGTVRIVDACSGDEAARSSVAQGSGAPAMALYVDTIVSSASSDSASLAVSYSDGSMCVHEATPAGRIAETHRWKAHSLEAWVATWSQSPSRRGNVIYSGGDDASFQAWDLRLSLIHISEPTRRS